MGQSQTKIPETHDVVEVTPSFMANEILRPDGSRGPPADDALQSPQRSPEAEKELREKVGEGAERLNGAVKKLAEEYRSMQCGKQRETLLKCMTESGGAEGTLKCHQLVLEFEACAKNH